MDVIISNDLMKLSHSPKIFQNYKCDRPKNTINRIEKGFKKIGLDIFYSEDNIGSSNFRVFVGSALIDILGAVQHGKGISSALAKASAYAELAERFSACFLDFKIPISGNGQEYENILKNINSRNFLKGFSKNNSISSNNYEYVNSFFQDKLDKKTYELYKKQGLLDYTVDAYSLINEKNIKLPLYLVELISFSNGIASGNTREEAIAQASFEIFERYSTSMLFLKNIKSPTIDIETIGNKEILDCIELFKSLNINIIIKDFSMGKEIPVIGVLFINKNLKKSSNKLLKERDYKRLNSGSHVNLNEAIMRCFIEYFQTVHLDRKEVFDQKNSEILYDIWVNKLGKQYLGVNNKYKYLTRYYDFYGDISFLEKGEKIDFNNLKTQKNKDSLDDISDITEICRKNKWGFYIIDYTHKILDFPTVRVVIPKVSTDIDLFSRKIIKIDELEKRINYLYSIKDFYRYLQNDDWINDKKQIKNLINNLEEYLSRELYFYNFYINRGNCSQLINLFHILPFLYLATGKPIEAKKYFASLLELKFKPNVDSSFFKSLSLTKYNLSFYKQYIDLIDKTTENNSQIKFRLTESPFDEEDAEYHIIQMHKKLLAQIDQTFE